MHQKRLARASETSAASSAASHAAGAGQLRAERGGADLAERLRAGDRAAELLTRSLERRARRTVQPVHVHQEEHVEHRERSRARRHEQHEQTHEHRVGQRAQSVDPAAACRPIRTPINQFGFAY